MSRTAKFSEALYDRLGHPVADELVDWFNNVDAAQRAEFRELHEQGVARFEATLKLAFTEFGRLMDQRFGEVDRQFAEIRRDMDQRFAESRRATDQRFAESRQATDQRFAEVNLRIEELRSGFRQELLVHTRWMIGMWVTVLLAIIGLWIRR